MSDIQPIDVSPFSEGGDEDELVRGSSGGAISRNPSPALDLENDPKAYFFPDHEVKAFALKQEMQRVNEEKWTAGGIPSGIEREDFINVVSAAYMAYTDLRQLPDVANIERYSTLSASRILEVIRTPEFVAAANARGIPWGKENGLSATQMLVAQILTNPTDKRPLRAKLKQVGVTYTQYRAWMHQPTFSQYMNRITEGMLVDHLPDFNTVLTNRALGGDLNAIKYVNELSGRHDPNRQQVLDLQAIVQNLLDIITRNVKDPETIQRISAEFSLAVNSKQTIQGEITRGPNT